MYAEQSKSNNNWLYVFLNKDDYDRFMSGETLTVSYGMAKEKTLCLEPFGEAKIDPENPPSYPSEARMVSKRGDGYSIVFHKGNAVHVPNVSGHFLRCHDDGMNIKIIWYSKETSHGYDKRIEGSSFSWAA